MKKRFSLQEASNHVEVNAENTKRLITYRELNAETKSQHEDSL
jgi:hypothetical protein